MPTSVLGVAGAGVGRTLDAMEGPSKPAAIDDGAAASPPKRASGRLAGEGPLSPAPSGGHVLHAPTPVEEVDARGLSRREFYARWVDQQRPVLLRGAAIEWPALKGDGRWTFEAIARQGCDKVLPVALSNEESERTVKVEMPLSRLIEVLLRCGEDDAKALGRPWLSPAVPSATTRTRSLRTGPTVAADGGAVQAGTGGSGGASVAGASVGGSRGAEGADADKAAEKAAARTARQLYDRAGAPSVDEAIKTWRCPTDAEAVSLLARALELRERGLYGRGCDMATKAAAAASGAGRASKGTSRGENQAPYLKQIDLLATLPELAADLRFGDLFTWRTILTINAWMGPPLALTGTHNDDENNISVQIMGVKRFTLFDPSQRPLLYPNDKYDSGTECCDVGADAPDLEKHPLFALARPMVAVLGPGDALYIPRYWYHHVRTVPGYGPSCSINAFASTPWEMLREGALRLLGWLAHNLGLYKPHRCVCHAPRA